MSVLVGAAASAAVSVSVGPTPPAQAAAAGYTRLAFNEDFNNTAGIDMADTRVAGFNFYRAMPFGYTQTPTGNIVVSGSVLTLTGPTGTANTNLISTTPTGVANQWRGFDALNGAYFECRMGFDPEPGGGASGWPAFWTMASQHLWAASLQNNFIEVDFFEALGNPGEYVHATHQWNYPGPSIITSSNHFMAPGGGFLYSDFHIYGSLWQPGNRIAGYRDNVLVFTDLFSTFTWMAQGDDNAWPIILGSDQWPCRYDWVRVWQVP